MAAATEAVHNSEIGLPKVIKSNKKMSDKVLTMNEPRSIGGGVIKKLPTPSTG